MEWCTAIGFSGARRERGTKRRVPLDEKPNQKKRHIGFICGEGAKLHDAGQGRCHYEDLLVRKKMQKKG